MPNNGDSVFLTKAKINRSVPMSFDDLKEVDRMREAYPNEISYAKLLKLGMRTFKMLKKQAAKQQETAPEKAQTDKP